MYFFILALLLIGCGDTVENYYSIAQPDAATTTTDASPDTAPDTFAPDTSQPDTYAPPDVAVDTWTADIWVEPDTYVTDAYVPPVDAAPNQICDGRFEILEPGSGPGFGISSPECRGGANPGRVKDLQTCLIWLRIGYYNCDVYDCHPLNYDAAAAHCVVLGMRMPTIKEAQTISYKDYNKCAFPCIWATWTTGCAGTMCTNVGYDGSFTQKEKTSGGRILCVK